MKQILFTLILLSSVWSFEKFEIELPLFINNGYVNIPNPLNPPIKEASSGIGYDIGVGANLKFNEYFGIRLGVHNWTKGLNTTVEGSTTFEDEQLDYTANESLTINYTGWYLNLERYWSDFFMEAGLEVAFSNSISADLDVELENGETASETQRNQSILTPEFNNIFQVILGMGYDFQLTPMITLTPNIKYSPFSGSIFDTGVMGSSPVLEDGHPTDEFTSEEATLQFYSSYKIGLTFRINFGANDA